MSYLIHSIDSAPANSKVALRKFERIFGFLPNVVAAMATSSVLLYAFIDIFAAVHSGTFSEGELQAILLTNAVVNSSGWPVALHTKLALAAGVSAADVEAIRVGRAPGEPRLAALSSFARMMLEDRGHLDGVARSRFSVAGISHETALEVILVIAASTITNYTATIAQPPLEKALEPYLWFG